MHVFGIGQGLLAVVAAGIAIFNLVFRHAALMWPVVSGQAVWQMAFIYGSALILLVASVGLLFRRSALPSALAIGAYQGICVLSCTTPILAKPLGFGSWYPVCEALTAAAGTMILVVALRREPPQSTRAPGLARIAGIGRILFALACVFYGASHFAFAQFTAALVPAWLPGKLGFAYLTGACYVAAGLGILFGVLPRLAAVLVAIMMSLFGLLVWIPSFFMHPTPAWATPPENQWSELLVTFVLVAAAWIVADSLSGAGWGRSRSSQPRLF